MEYNVGDVVKTKKQHPCGSKYNGKTKSIKSDYEKNRKRRKLTAIKQSVSFFEIRLHTTYENHYSQQGSLLPVQVQCHFAQRSTL